MKAKLFVMLILLSGAFTGMTQRTSPLVGTWKLVSGTMSLGDSTLADDMSKMEAMKIVTPTHFAVFNKDISTGDIGSAGAGTVKVAGNDYTETITHATGTGNKYPIVAKYKFELNGDRWRIKGGFDKYTFDETWQRVK